jgi:hypothetical protein
VLTYFIPELATHRKKSVVNQWWRELVTDKTDGAAFSLIVPAELKEVKPDALQVEGAFDAFKALRAAGKNPLPLLEAIRRDNVADFLPYVARNKYDLPIPFSVYEQYFHFDYIIEPDNQGDEQDRKRKFKRLPNLIDAIAFFGARECFGLVITAQQEHVKPALDAAVDSIVAAGSQNGFLSRAIEAGLQLTGDNLVGVVRFHSVDGLDFC